MKTKTIKKLTKYALDQVERNLQFIADELEDELGMTKEEIQQGIDEIRLNFVLVPVDDPGLRMVETEISL